MRITTFLVGLALVFAFAVAPSQSAAQQPAPKVVNVLTYDVAGDIAGFVQFYRRAMEIMLQHDSTGEGRLWLATLAGANAGMVTVAIEYPNMVSMAESAAKVFPTPEWQKLVADFDATQMRVLSNSVMEDRTP
jgi:hypothetical protein